jgi:hypothetical protein
MYALTEENVLDVKALIENSEASNRLVSFK